MGHKPDPETIKLQQKNLASFRAWMKSHGGNVLPIPGKSVVYAGFPKTEFSKMRKQAQKQGAPMEPMWQALEKINKLSRDHTGHLTYDTINDVLKRLKGPLPKLFETTGANRGHPKRYANMLDVANALCDRNWQLLPRGDHKGWVWGELSALYVANSKGQIDIFEGSQKVLKQLDKRFVLIDRELEAILKNKSLSKETHATARAIAKRYSEHHSKAYAQFKTYLQDSKKNLREAAKP